MATHRSIVAAILGIVELSACASTKPLRWTDNVPAEQVGGLHKHYTGLAVPFMMMTIAVVMQLEL